MRHYLPVLLLCLLSACSANHYVSGLLAKDRGDYAAALEELGKVSPDHPIYARAQAEIKDIRGRTRVQSKAADRLKKAAEDALSRGNRVAARVDLKKLLALQPGNTWAGERMKELDEAPPPKERKLREIEALIAQRRFYEAKSSLEGFLRKNPTNSRAQSDLRMVDSSLARNEEKVEDLLQKGEEAAGEGDTVTAYLSYTRANALLPEDDRARTARDELEPAVAPALDDNVQKARDLAAQGKGEEAVGLLETNLQARPAHVPSRTLLIQTLSSLALDSYRTSNYERAADYWKKLLVYDPKNAKAREYIKKARRLAERVKAM